MKIGHTTSPMQRSDRIRKTYVCGRCLELVFGNPVGAAMIGGRVRGLCKGCTPIMERVVAFLRRGRGRG